MKGLVITAKHHDGFCLWPSKYTEHSIKNSPYKNGKGDIVMEVAEACRKGGIKFGFYLSPWDRNSKLYGTPEYNDYYRAQLTELLTGYGEVFHVWFDGACGEGPNGKKQVYDYESYIELIRKYQPNATIFNDHGPDVRWIGNESGISRYAEWAVVPKELTWFSEVQTSGQLIDGDLSHIYNTNIDIGSLSNIMYSKGLTFCGSEVDMSIRKGWFYHEEEEPHSLERLFNTYINSVGGNACLNLNIPPNRDGLFDARDVRRLSELGELINKSFANNLAASAKILRHDTSETQCNIEIALDTYSDIKYIVIKEDIAQGQKVETFIVQALDENGIWQDCYFGTCIGNKKICQLKNNVQTNAIKIKITSARDKAILKSIKIY